MAQIPDLIGNEFFSMDIQGYNRVANNLRGAVASIPGKAADVTYRWAQNTRLVLKTTPYPPRRFLQRYKRTGRLANSWRVARLPSGARIYNTAHKRGRFYSRYVVGNARGDGQAWMHKGRWWKAREKVDEQAPALRRLLAAAVVEEITG